MISQCSHPSSQRCAINCTTYFHVGVRFSEFDDWRRPRLEVSIGRPPPRSEQGKDLIRGVIVATCFFPSMHADWARSATVTPQSSAIEADSAPLRISEKSDRTLSQNRLRPLDGHRDDGDRLLRPHRLQSRLRGQIRLGVAARGSVTQS